MNSRVSEVTKVLKKFLKSIPTICIPKLQSTMISLITQLFLVETCKQNEPSFFILVDFSVQPVRKTGVSVTSTLISVYSLIIKQGVVLIKAFPNGVALEQVD